jgi:hypothetical protein
MLVFTIASFYFARRHLGRALLCALGKGAKGYDAAEPSSYRTAFIVLLVGLAVMVLWLRKAGLPPGYGCIFVAVAILIFYGLSRLVAQCGVAVTIAPMIASPFMTSTFGGANMTAHGIMALNGTWVWHSDIRTSVMSSAAHAMYLARRRARGLFGMIMLAAAITLGTATLSTIWLGYRHGAANMHPWFFINGPRAAYEWGLQQIAAGQPPNYAGYFWTGTGAAVMSALIMAHRSFPWWPVHPVGFVICSVGWTDTLWATIFLAWAMKLLVTLAGGNRALRRARRCFLGMILGQFTVAGVWAIYDTLTGTVGHGIFWI